MPKDSGRPFQMSYSKLIAAASNEYARRRTTTTQVTKKFFRSHNNVSQTTVNQTSHQQPLKITAQSSQSSGKSSSSSKTTRSISSSSSSTAATVPITRSSSSKPAAVKAVVLPPPATKSRPLRSRISDPSPAPEPSPPPAPVPPPPVEVIDDSPVESPAVPSVESVVESPIASPLIRSEIPEPSASPTSSPAPSPDESLPSNEEPPTPLEDVVKEPSVPAVVNVPASKPTKRKFFTSVKNSNKPQINHLKFFKPDTFTDDLLGDETSASAQESSNNDDEYVRLEKVRKAHQCHELGETESFDEDIKYYLNSLEKSNPIHIRCLSIEALTSQCMGAEFRMHLRAHDDMPKITSALSDAPVNPNLAFCTAVLMFIYNQDRLTMDIDPKQLSLMLDLLETKDTDDKFDMKHQKKAKPLVEQMKTRGHGKFLDPSHLSTGKLALEALLGLTSKRAGDWFKEELRKLKGLDYLMNTVIKIVEADGCLQLEAELNKVERTLRVLEAATFMHEENQLYTINYQSGLLIHSCTKLLELCKDSIVLNDSRIHLSTLLSVLRLFTNVTSESAQGSELLGSQFNHLLSLFLDILFEVPSFIYPDSRFDLMILVLCLCINLVEFVKPLRKELLRSTWKVKRLVEILVKRIDEAKETEQQADDLLDSAEKGDGPNEVVNIDTLLNQVVAKSGKHMEHSIIAACVSLLLGCTIQRDPEGRDEISHLLPNGSFEPLIDVLTKLREFANLAVSCIINTILSLRLLIHFRLFYRI